MAENSTIQVRNQYLKTLGIVQYRSKDIPADQPAETIQAVSQTSKPEKSQSADISSVIAALSDQPVKSTNIEAKSTIAERNITQDLSLKFVFWQPSDQLLVATAVNDQLPDKLQISLLKNILLTMDKDLVSLPQFDIVNWPPHPSMSGDEADARGFLSTLINSKLASKPTKTALFLGDLTQDWLLSEEQKDNIIDGAAELSKSVTALLIPSLQNMLNQPETKRKAWNIIRKYLSSQANFN